MELDWLKFNESSPFLDHFFPEIIVGCDIIYDLDLHPHLINTISLLSKRNKNLVVYLANAVRTLETFDKFIEISKKYNFSVEEVKYSSIENTYFHYEKRCTEIKILKLLPI